MSARRTLAAIIVTGAFVLGIGWLGRAPWDAAHSDAGLLRLSWRLRDAGANVCRQRTQAELDALPVHMRTPEVCEHHGGAYRLVVRIDGRADTARVVAGGVKSDRPVYVFWERPLQPGVRDVHVEFRRTADVPGRPSLLLEMQTVLDARAGAIELVTLEGEPPRLVHRGSAALSPSPQSAPQ